MPTITIEGDESGLTFTLVSCEATRGCKSVGRAFCLIFGPQIEADHFAGASHVNQTVSDGRIVAGGTTDGLEAGFDFEFLRAGFGQLQFSGL